MVFKRLEEGIKMLTRSENKLEDMLLKIDNELTKISDAVKEYQSTLLVETNLRSAESE